MEEIIARYSHIIQFCEVSKDEVNVNTSYFYVRIKFKNGTELDVKERFLLDVQYLRYGYQWMNADNTLIIRWDNAPHAHQVATMPHHKHVGSEENVQPSEPMTLQKVLAYIAKVIGLFVVVCTQFFFLLKGIR